MSEFISEIFLRPALELIPQIPGHRSGPTYSDVEFVTLGLLRIQSLQPSGRGFLQSARQQDLTEASLRAYFGAAQSNRRLGFLHELNRQVSLQVRAPTDRFAISSATPQNASGNTCVWFNLRSYAHRTDLYCV